MHLILVPMHLPNYTYNNNAVSLVYILLVLVCIY